MLRKLDPAACGREAAEVLGTLNLLDLDHGGAEMIGGPIHARLWQGEQLRHPFPALLEFYLKERPGSTDAAVAAAFVVRIAAVISYVERALTDG